MEKAKLISVVVPFHNEALNLPLLYQKLHKVSRAIQHRFEFIFIDDGSADNSVKVVERLAVKDKRVHVIELSRNFGKEAAVAAGIKHARGQGAIIMDADVQHPPEMIPNFIERWESGADVVIGIRDYHKKEPHFKRFMSALFYKIMEHISYTKITPHATDFRLIDRRVINEFNTLTEHNRMNRGLIDWLGFKRDYVHFVAGLRQYGEARYTFNKLLKLAISSFTAYSLFPLKLAGYLGVLILIISAPLGAFVAIERFILGDPLGLQITGTAILAIIILFMIGLVLACLGLVSMYIAQIHAEVTNRPLYVVRRTILSDEEGDAA